MKLNFKRPFFWIALVIVLSFLLVMTFSNQGFYEHYLQQKKLAELEARIDSLKKVNDSLSVEIELLKNNPEKIEKVAREKYGMIKPGEKVYKIQIEE
ncbi:MAG: septum formation initiator family protein [Ignavibacteria bacterium]|nr:septum formation initiator family protein [Ignavibacteria bacterium]